MKPSEVLRHAAKRIEDRGDGYGCTEIGKFVRRTTGYLYGWRSHPLYTEAMKYFQYFQPASHPVTELWFEGSDAQDRRILALCFAAAIAESEGR